MHYPTSAIDEIIAHEKPIKLNPEQVVVDDIGTTLASEIRKFQREQKRAEHFANIRENYKPCRKNKCGLFHKNCCFNKSFEEQKKCFDNREFEKPSDAPQAEAK